MIPVVGALEPQTVILRGDHAPALNRPVVVGVEDETVVVEQPAPPHLFRHVYRPRGALDVGAVGPKLEGPAAPRRRQRLGRRAKDQLVLAVLLVEVGPLSLQGLAVGRAHPRRISEVAADRYSPASFFRGPARVAFIRATCPAVNMTIVSSST